MRSPKLFVALLLVCFLGNSLSANDVKTYIPTKAYQYLPTLKSEQIKYWGNHPAPEQLGGLVEHESCTNLTNSRCWSPTSQLKTPKEEGAGLGQITRAYDKNGKLRFDALAEIRDKHPALSGWSWENVYQKPDYQIKAVVLKSNDNYKSLNTITDPKERLKFSDAAYNGGMGGVQNDRRACGLKSGCNPQIWFGNVELTCTKSKAALYDKRSPCFFNRNHVDDVINIRSNKYKPYLQNVVVAIPPKVVVEKDKVDEVKKSLFSDFKEFIFNCLYKEK